jgi:hypothetical protein
MKAETPVQLRPVRHLLRTAARLQILTEKTAEGNLVRGIKALETRLAEFVAEVDSASARGEKLKKEREEAFRTIKAVALVCDRAERAGLVTRRIGEPLARAVDSMAIQLQEHQDEKLDVTPANRKPVRVRDAALDLLDAFGRWVLP